MNETTYRLLSNTACKAEWELSMKNDRSVEVSAEQYNPVSKTTRNAQWKLSRKGWAICWAIWRGIGNAKQKNKWSAEPYADQYSRQSVVKAFWERKNIAEQYCTETFAKAVHERISYLTRYPLRNTAMNLWGVQSTKRTSDSVRRPQSNSVY